MDYIDESLFEELIQKYQKNPEDTQTANALAEMFTKLIQGVIYGTSLKYFYRHTSLQLQDLIQEGLLKCFIELKKYTPEKGKAFSFFSVIVKHALILYINKNLYFYELSTANLNDFNELIKNTTEKQILMLIKEWIEILDAECRKILPQYKYSKYLRAKNFLQGILSRGFYEKSDLLYIKNNIWPIIKEIELGAEKEK
jgi:RNA polymerase sigma factor (sigma-70 family)